MTQIDTLIIVCGLLGLALVYWAKKRRFQRTTIYGTEQFQTYPQQLGSKLLDAMLWGLGLGGIGSATLLVFVEYAPVWGFLILLLAVAFAFEKDYYRDKRS